MYATMLSLVGFILGVAAFGFVGGLAGIALGGAIGFGLSARAAEDATTISPHDKVVAVHNVLCLTKGKVAKAELVGSVSKNRWVDVESCSLSPDGQIRCEKGCVKTMAHARPSETRDLEAV